MAKKRKKIVLFAVIAVCVFCLLTVMGVFLKDRKEGSQEWQYDIALATSDDNVIPYVANSYVEEIWGCNVQTIIDSPQALHELDAKYGFSEEYDRDFFELFGIYIYKESNFGKKICEYDEEFFNDKELLFIAITIGDYEPRDFKGLELVNDEFIVTIEKPFHEGECDFAASPITHIFVVELDKSIGTHPIVVNTVEKK